MLPAARTAPGGRRDLSASARARLCTRSASTRSITTPPPVWCATGRWSRQRRRSASRGSSTPSAHPTPAEWEAAWDPLFLSSIVNAPRQLASGAPHHLAARFRGARPDGPYRWHFVEHHLAHAVSAFHASPFERAAVLTLDGRGELASTSYSLGQGN